MTEITYTYVIEMTRTFSQYLGCYRGGGRSGPQQWIHRCTVCNHVLIMNRKTNPCSLTYSQRATGIISPRTGIVKHTHDIDTGGAWPGRRQRLYILPLSISTQTKSDVFSEKDVIRCIIILTIVTIKPIWNQTLFSACPWLIPTIQNTNGHENH